MISDQAGLLKSEFATDPLVCSGVLCRTGRRSQEAVVNGGVVRGPIIVRRSCKRACCRLIQVRLAWRPASSRKEPSRGGRSVEGGKTPKGETMLPKRARQGFRAGIGAAGAGMCTECGSGTGALELPAMIRGCSNPSQERLRSVPGVIRSACSIFGVGRPAPMPPRSTSAAPAESRSHSSCAPLETAFRFPPLSLLRLSHNRPPRRRRAPPHEAPARVVPLQSGSSTLRRASARIVCYSCTAPALPRSALASATFRAPG